MDRKEYCDRVLAQVGRLTSDEANDLRNELAGHIEDHAEALVEHGYTEDAAYGRAVALMGDPEETGRALRAQYGGWWLVIVQRVARILTDVLSTMPRGEIDEDIGTDIRMNALEAEPRYVTETLPVAQGQLAVGYRLGACMTEPDIPALFVFNALYGGCVTSKLFLNVREKLSLCYYVGSRLSTHKGLLTVTSGIDVKNYERALAEITAQLDAVRTGDFTDGELRSAIRSVASDLRATADAPDALAWYWLNRTVQGLDIDPAEMAALVEEVTRTDVTDIAAGVVCDCVYLLKGTEETADDE